MKISSREVPVRSLKLGQRLTGVIREICTFGLFVDVGAQRDGLATGPPNGLK